MRRRSSLSSMAKRPTTAWRAMPLTARPRIYRGCEEAREAKVDHAAVPQRIDDRDACLLRDLTRLYPSSLLLSPFFKSKRPT